MTIYRVNKVVPIIIHVSAAIFLSSLYFNISSSPIIYTLFLILLYRSYSNMTKHEDRIQYSDNQLVIYSPKNRFQTRIIRYKKDEFKVSEITNLYAKVLANGTVTHIKISFRKKNNEKKEKINLNNWMISNLSGFYKKLVTDKKLKVKPQLNI